MGHLRAFLRDLRVGRETAGFSALTSRILALTIERAFQNTRLIVIEQDLAEVTALEPPRGVTIRAFEGDWDAVEPILTSRGHDRFKTRIEAGRRCLIALRDERAIGYTWISPEIDREIEFLPLALPPNAAYLWDLFVILSERSEGIGSALTSARLAYARETGFTLGWRAIAPTNRPSLRTAEKTRAVRILGEIEARRRFGWTRFDERRAGGRALLTQSAARDGP